MWSVFTQETKTMFHYTSEKRSNNVLISCNFKGWHSDLYDTYFDDFITTHIDFANHNELDYHCFNDGLLDHYSITKYGNSFIGLPKFFAAMYAIDVMGYDNVYVTDIDTKFKRLELIPSEMINSDFVVSMKTRWDKKVSTWALYSMMGLGIPYENVSKLKYWYGGGFFKVSKYLGFQSHLWDYFNFAKDVANGGHPVSPFYQNGRYIKSPFTPYDEAFIQHMIAKNDSYIVAPTTYNTTNNTDDTILFHYTNKSLIPLECNIGNTLLNHR